MLPLRVYPFPFAISACLHSLLAPKPHLIPLFPSICQKPLYLHSTSSFHLRQTKCSIAFPSVVMKLEGEDKEGVTRERYRGKERERRSRGGRSELLTTLPWNNSIVPSPSAGEQEVIALCLHLTPFSLSLCFHLPNPPRQLSHDKMHVYTLTTCTHEQKQWAKTQCHHGSTRTIEVTVFLTSWAVKAKRKPDEARTEWQRFYMLRTTNGNYSTTIRGEDGLWV